MTVTRPLLVIAVLLLLVAVGSEVARGERVQSGNLIVSLDGDLAPLKLPRDRLAPVSVRLHGALHTADGSVLPRVTRIELALPKQGVLSRRGLPRCPRRRLLNVTFAQARAGCGGAQVGHGELRADVVLPNQRPFRIDADLLAFNGRVAGGPGLLLYAFAAKPPTVAVLPLAIRHRAGRLGTTLVANLPATLGPWPHLAGFDLTLSRRYRYGGRRRSYLSASCPISRPFTAGFFSLAQARFTLVDGRQVGTAIARGCRAR
jgi:hypothetical protein